MANFRGNRTDIFLAIHPSIKISFDSILQLRIHHIVMDVDIFCTLIYH